MTDSEYFHKEIKKIKERNRKVEINKAWETSLTRKIAIAVLTYFVVCTFFITIGVEQPFINAIVPVFGFLASTLSFDALKQWWVKRRYESTK